MTKALNQLNPWGATRGYLSPERWAGSTLHGRSDTFRLGTVLFEMATGEPCFQGQKQREVLTALWHMEAPMANPAFTHGMDCQMAGLGTLIHQCLPDQPDHRHSDASGLADGLRALSRSA